MELVQKKFDLNGVSVPKDHDSCTPVYSGLSPKTVNNHCGIINKGNTCYANVILQYNTISLSRHEQICLSELDFERYFSHHQAKRKDKNKWVINMSSRQLTRIETDLLAKGFNFSITSKTLPNKDIIATVEDAVKDLEKEEADTICAKVSLTLQNSKPPKDNLSKDERKALKELQSDTSNVILPAGKGRSTVILNHEDYLEKCMDHINNGPYQ